jgi:hypothetical protein
MHRATLDCIVEPRRMDGIERRPKTELMNLFVALETRSSHRDPVDCTLSPSAVLERAEIAEERLEEGRLRFGVGIGTGIWGLEKILFFP